MNRDIKTELQLKNFYNQEGWAKDQHGNSIDAALWEDLRPVANEYVENCRKRINHCFPSGGDFFLDAASGPIQYPEYLEYSSKFKKRVCVDISESALEQAKAKLGDKGEYICCSLQELPFPNNHFDAVLSLHTIYHIEKDQQVLAVRELIRVAKPGSPIIIVYANPNKFLSRIKQLLKPRFQWDPTSGPIYYYAHPLHWWYQFNSVGKVKLSAWRMLTAQDSKRLIPNNFIGALMLKIFFAFEHYFPGLASWLGAYSIISIYKE